LFKFSLGILDMYILYFSQITSLSLSLYPCSAIIQQFTVHYSIRKGKENDREWIILKCNASVNWRMCNVMHSVSWSKIFLLKFLSLLLQHSGWVEAHLLINLIGKLNHYVLFPFGWLKTDIVNFATECFHTAFCVWRKFLPWIRLSSAIQFVLVMWHWSRNVQTLKTRLFLQVTISICTQKSLKSFQGNVSGHKTNAGQGIYESF
jgi:hypothetical protein